MKEMTLREIQLFSLEILKDVHAFCEKHQLRYALYAGSLLGAIRHNGFIPWDDDIDIIMPRPDYDTFCSIYNSKEYDIINNGNDKSFVFAYSRVCDKKRTIYKTKYPCNKDGMGVWIDIFPADGFPMDSKKIQSFYQKALKIERRKIFLRGGLENFQPILSSTFRQTIWNIKHNISILLKKTILFINRGQNPFLKKQLSLCKTFVYGSTSYWGSITDFFDHPIYHSISDFELLDLHPFEDSLFYIPKEYDDILKILYGDYMKFPPREKQIPNLKGIYKFYWQTK